MDPGNDFHGLQKNFYNCLWCTLPTLKIILINLQFLDDGSSALLLLLYIKLIRLSSVWDGNYTTRVLPSFGLALLAGLHAMWEEFGQSLSLSRHRRVSSIAISNCDIPVCNCQSGFRCQTLNTKQVRGVPRQYILPY